MTDYTVTGGSSIWLVRPENDAARQHLEENVEEEALWFGGSLAVELRYIGDLVLALQRHGFAVAFGRGRVQ